MIPLGSKQALPWVIHKLETYKQRRKLKKSFSETGNLKAFIFGMQHLLVDVNQVCSYDAPGVKTGPALWVTSLNIATNKENFRIFFL